MTRWQSRWNRHKQPARLPTMLDQMAIDPGGRDFNVCSLLPPLMASTLQELDRHYQSPTAMNLSILLASCSVPVQNCFVVKRAQTSSSPTGLSCIAIAEPSERKSAVTAACTRVFDEFTQKQSENAEMLQHEHKAAMQIHATKVKLLERQINKAIANDADTHELRRQYAELLGCVPKLAKPRRLTISTATFEKTLEVLHEQNGAIAWLIGEGGTFFNSSMARHAATIADAWSGNSIQYETKTAGNFTIPKPKIAMLIAVQEEVLKKFLKSSGSSWFSTGLMSRFLVCHPQTTRGTRIEYPGLESKLDISKYENRMRELLADCTPERVKNPTELTFDRDAQILLTDYSNQIEKQMGQNGVFEDVAGAAGKTVENTARIAAVFHVFEGYDGNISFDTTQRAIAVSSLYLDEYKRILGEVPRQNKVVKAAYSIIDKVFDWQCKTPLVPCKRTYVAQYGCPEVRDKEIREEALALLMHHQVICQVFVPGDVTKYIGLTLSGRNMASKIRYTPNIDRSRFPPLDPQFDSCY